MRAVSLIVLLITLFTFGTAQSNCRSYAPRMQECKVHTVSNCTTGAVVWPYPIGTCKFPLTLPENQKKAFIIARAPPVSWIIEDLKGKELSKGRGMLNTTVALSKSKGVVVVLTYPSSVNLFQMTLGWKFEK